MAFEGRAVEDDDGNELLEGFGPIFGPVVQAKRFPVREAMHNSVNKRESLMVPWLFGHGAR